MPGIGFSEKISYYLNKSDVGGCINLGARLTYCYYFKYGFNIRPIYQTPYLLLWTTITMALGGISEYDKYNPKLKWLYIPTHCLWHLSIFPLICYFLEKLIY